MKNRRLFWNVVEQMEAHIDSGVYPSGARLPTERELVQTYKVSRPTIREAIIALEVRERVEVKTGTGVYIAEKCQTSKPENNISAFELTQARALIEGEAASLAATTISDEELRMLERTLLDMENNVAPDDADKVFHLTISTATRNKALMKSVQDLWNLRDSSFLIQQAYGEICANQNRTNRLAEHRAIYSAIERKNASEARAAMHQHFNRLINALLDASEAKALAAIRKKTTEKRGLYTLNRFASS